MKAVVHERYGPPEVLRVGDVERPVPEEDEVLVRVHASSVTRSDCGVRGTEYFFARVFTGILRPKRIVAGMSTTCRRTGRGAARSTASSTRLARARSARRGGR